MMTEQDIRDRLVAEFDKPENPNRADLKNRCMEAAEIQWWAQQQLELLHIFDAPRCALTETQFEANWNSHVLRQIRWETVRENTVAEAVARDQLRLLRSSLVDMVRFLKQSHATTTNPEDPFLGPYRPKFIRGFFNVEEKGWTDFANRYRDKGRLKYGIGSNGLETPKLVLICRSVFTEYGVAPPS